MVTQDLSGSSAEDLTAGLKTLNQHSVALQNEIGHYDRVVSILQQLASQQVITTSDTSTQYFEAFPCHRGARDK